MQNDNSHGSCASVTRGFIALFAMLSMGLAAMASRADAAPFAYVTAGSGTVVVIDTATNTVVATVPVGENAVGVAVTPDGKHAYVTNVSTTRHNGHQNGGRQGPGGKFALWGRRHPGWETRLCRESTRYHCFGDRYGQQYRGGHGRGGE